jgi:putative hemolysin
VLNGVFAMSEIAVVTARRIRLEHRAEAGDRGAQAALELAREPTQFLSTVQVGITLIGVLAGAFGGASIAEQLADRFRASATLAPYADGLGLTIVVGAITYLSLIIGELVPKRIALGAPERIASFVARPMRVVSRVTAPVVQVLTGSTNLMLRLLGVRPHGEPGLTEEEIRAVLEQGAESGVVEPREHELVESVFRLGDRNVGSIMTPRPELDWIDLADAAPGRDAALVEQLATERRGLYLACEEDLDHVTGFVHAEDLLADCLRGGAVDVAAVRTAARAPLFVPASMPVMRLLDAFRASRQHAAVVLDEYGGVDGLVTLHDVLEAIVGDLPSVDDEDDSPAISRRPDGSWLVDGSLPIVDLEAKLDVELHEAEGPTGYQTLAGFVLARLGRLPKPGDRFRSRDHRFEVVAMDGRRVDRVLISTAQRETPEIDATADGG